MLAVGALGVLLLQRRDRRHRAMLHLPAQPAEKCAHQKLGIEPVGLGAAMLTWHRNAARTDHIRLDPSPVEPARQPEAVTAGFIGDRPALDLAAGLHRLL